MFRWITPRTDLHLKSAGVLQILISVSAGSGLGYMLLEINNKRKIRYLCFVTLDGDSLLEFVKLAKSARVFSENTKQLFRTERFRRRSKSMELKGFMWKGPCICTLPDSWGRVLVYAWRNRWTAWSVEQHFIKVHNNFSRDFWAGSSLRKKKVKELKTTLQKQQSH